MGPLLTMRFAVTLWKEALQRLNVVGVSRRYAGQQCARRREPLVVVR